MTRILLLLPLFAFICQPTRQVIKVDHAEGATWSTPSDSLIHPSEKHFKRLKQLTFGGDNAEAYWSFDGSKLIFQSTNPKWGESCDQIHIFDPFHADLRNGKPELISLEGGRTTCSYFLPGDSTVLFASTHEHAATCP
ncbi:MAG TPA: hypothetical protein PK760_11575, partial [Flavobacteriales bacterium]|nr:hypothetical protein [Flavobacteriales bacterium]